MACDGCKWYDNIIAGYCRKLFIYNNNRGCGDYEVDYKTILKSFIEQIPEKFKKMELFKYIEENEVKEKRQKLTYENGMCKMCYKSKENEVK